MAGLYSHTTRASGLTLTATIYNEDHQNHINNQVPDQMDDWSVSDAQAQTHTDPFPNKVLDKPVSLAGEVERMRYVMRQVKGTTHWYEDGQMLYRHLITITATAAVTGFNAVATDGLSTTMLSYAVIHRIIASATDGPSLLMRLGEAGGALSSGARYHQHRHVFRTTDGSYISDISGAATTKFLLDGELTSAEGSSQAGITYIICPPALLGARINSDSMGARVGAGNAGLAGSRVMGGFLGSSAGIDRISLFVSGANSIAINSFMQIWGLSVSGIAT